MKDIEIIGEPEITTRSLPNEEKFLEVIWDLNLIPNEDWDKEFEKLLKKHLEKENDLFGPYKPKIIFTQLILTISNELNVKKQKKYFEDEFIAKVNEHFHE